MGQVVIDEELMKELRADFFDDLDEKIHLMNQGILTLEKKGLDISACRNLYRLLHNLKGTSGTLGLIEISVIAHRAEDLLSLIMDKTIEITPSNVADFFAMVDSINKLSTLYKKESTKEEIQVFFDDKIKNLNRKTIQILLVENSKSIRKFIKKTLTEKGYHVSEAADSLTALIRGITEPIDFLVTSKELAVLDGVNLIHMIKANDKTKNLKTVIITSDEFRAPHIDKIINKDKDMIPNLINFIRKNS